MLILYEKHEQMCELCEEDEEKPYLRALRRHHFRRIRKNNSFRIKTEPYEGFANKPMNMCCLIPSKYKKLLRRQRRAKEKHAMRSGELIPLFKKSDSYDWW